MEQLAALLLTLRFYGHAAHNLCAKPTFFQDHSFFAEVYEAADADYDSVVERCIGLKGTVDLKLITNSANEQFKLLNVAVKENKEFYTTILQLEDKVCSMVEQLCKASTEGTKQLIGEIANQSEIRKYKIKQRIKV